MSETMNIFQRMSAITQEITAVAKNLSVGVGKSSYRAAGEADVLSAVKPIEAKHGVYSYPLDREIIESAVLTTQRTYNGEVSESKQQFMRLRVVYRFVNVDDPKEFIDITTYGDGVDPQDKAPGKAMTYADKYALLKAYKIITGEDPDQKASEPIKDKTTKNNAPMASDKQIKFIQSFYDKGEPFSSYIEKNASAPGNMTMAEATDLIGKLKDMEDGSKSKTA